MRIARLLLGTGLAFACTALAMAAPLYRELDPLEEYPPRVEGDRMFSNTYPLWRDRARIDPTLAGDPERHWKLNWKFMDPPFNRSLHGGHLALERGRQRYAELNRGGAFARCLGARGGRLKGLRATYPRYRADLKRVVGLEEAIEHCATQRGEVLENGSYDNSAVSLYIASHSNNVPIRIDVSRGPLKEAFERGRIAWHSKTGRFNFACSSCHVRNIGRHLRGNVVTTPFGDVAHYPVYRTRYDLESLHVRIIACQLDSGTQPLRPGNPVYTDLEVFLTALSNGYPVQVPAERH